MHWIPRAFSLALANKMQMIFEKEDKFLTYPLGVGFDYLYLSFMKEPSASGLTLQEQLNALDLDGETDDEPGPNEPVLPRVWTSRGRSRRTIRSCQGRCRPSTCSTIRTRLPDASPARC